MTVTTVHADRVSESLASHDADAVVTAGRRRKMFSRTPARVPGLAPSARAVGLDGARGTSGSAASYFRSPTWALGLRTRAGRSSSNARTCSSYAGPSIALEFSELHAAGSGVPAGRPDGERGEGSGTETWIERAARRRCS
jgi:hypothetical protein